LNNCLSNCQNSSCDQCQPQFNTCNAQCASNCQTCTSGRGCADPAACATATQ
jgi:hypothetical protein